MNAQKKIRIAWIDDDADVLEPVTRLLDRQRFELHEYYTYAEALRETDAICNSDLIFLDLILPLGRGVTLPDGIDEQGKDQLGWALLKALKAHGCHAPVIVFSILANSPDAPAAKELIELGVIDQISKPVRPSDLKERVEERFPPE